jgi:DNA topoisomerase-1
MQKNLVIVESPAKAKTIQNYLGDDYKVMSSYGHIRDLKKKNFGIDLDTFQPEYEIPKDKASIVKELKAAASKAENVWLASDEDREGEAISWHLAEVLNLPIQDARRIVFHEITKPAILNAIKNPRAIDINLVDAQQARRVLDRIVGFKLSPVLWRKVKPSLSAGRVQSVAVKLIVEREREIQKFKSESNFRVTAEFNINGSTFRAELNRRFPTADKAREFLEACKGSDFKISDITVHPQKRMPAPPFTTSTLQQEAARKFGFPVSLTMSLAQQLYESGLITYMRTDSVNLSSLCVNACKDVISRTLGKEYSKPRKYVTHSKGAQEAHEAIRPTDMQNDAIEGSPQAQRLYKLIWQRTIACQMSDAITEKTTVDISIKGHEEKFTASGEVVKFDGFLRVYRESHDNEDANSENRTLPAIKKDDCPEAEEITATQRFSQHPPRYNEAGLVHKMEELGIGRPSTYAPIISTIQQRQYVTRGDKEGTERKYDVITLKGGNINETTKTEITGAERNKLFPTDVGIVVTDFLDENFPEIMDYNFTADVEKQFDEVAEGKKEWTGLMHDFYENFEPQVEKTLADKSGHKAGERQLGIDPQSGRPVFVKIGRYGPMVQIGQAGDEEKPVFATMKKGQSTETLTLEEALELFKLPRTLGEFEDKEVSVGAGRFGPYIKHDGKYVSLPKDEDPLKVSLEKAVELILAKREAEAKRFIKSFEEDPEMEILNGPYGPYISYKKKNYRLPKDKKESAAGLTFDECMKIINAETEKPKKTPRARGKKKA